MFPTIGSVSRVKTWAGSFWSTASRRPEVAVGGGPMIFHWRHRQTVVVSEGSIGMG